MPKAMCPNRKQYTGYMSQLAFRKKSVSVTSISNMSATSAYVNRLNLWHFIQFCILDQQQTVIVVQPCEQVTVRGYQGNNTDSGIVTDVQ